MTVKDVSNLITSYFRKRNTTSPPQSLVRYKQLFDLTWFCALLSQSTLLLYAVYQKMDDGPLPIPVNGVRHLSRQYVHGKGTYI